MKKSRFYVALLHYPMYNKRMDIITTSVSNLDLHDISRAAKTYRVERFFVVHPVASQQQLIREILDYWQQGYGGIYNSDRKEALSIIQIASDLEEVVRCIEQERGRKPKLVATDARHYSGSVAYNQLRQTIRHEDKDLLLLLGTGWGMEEQFVAACDYILEPIAFDSTYNHLSVRSAAAIILDRLLSEK